MWRTREDRLFQALGRLEENHRVDLAANDAYEQWRAGSRDTLGRVMKGYSKPYTPPEAPDGTINLSDPDSRVMRSKGLPHRQAYNVQTAVTEQQIIVAAEISLAAPDFGHLEPILDQALAHLSRHGVTEPPEAVVGDAGYWHTRQIETIVGRGIEVLVPPDGAAREGKRPGWEEGLYEQMREKLKTDRGRALYALRTGLLTFIAAATLVAGSASHIAPDVWDGLSATAWAAVGVLVISLISPGSLLKARGY